MPLSATDVARVARRRAIIDPRSDGGYAALAGEAGRAGDVRAWCRAVVAECLIANPPASDVRMLVGRVLPAASVKLVLPLLWRLAETGSYPFEEIIERGIADEPELSAVDRRKWLTYLLRGAPLASPSWPHVVCAMPGSAGGLVSQIVAGMTGLPVIPVGNSNDAIGTGLEKGRIQDLCQQPAVVYGRFAANPRTICYFRLLSARPIVVVRNIFDALSASAGDVLSDVAGEYRRADQLNYAVLRMAALYVDFYATWVRARGRFPMLWVDYEEVRHDPQSLVERIGVHLGADALHRARPRDGTSEALPDAWKQSLRLGDGRRTNHGGEFSDAHRDCVRKLYAIYADVDFRSIDPGV